MYNEKMTPVCLKSKISDKAIGKFRKLNKYYIIIIGIIIIWTILYFLTTTISKNHGNGGMSGPMDVRVFKSVSHLIAFYPIYLSERIIRNYSIFNADYYFNCDFENKQYDYEFLYGDGKYSRFWFF